MTKPEISRSDSRIRRDKTTVRGLLESKKIDALLESLQRNGRLLRVLSSLLYDKDESICFRAAHALGRVSAVIAGRDPSRIRNLLRRLLWTMNDESGSICWFAPEAIGEILACNPQFLEEFCVLLASFIREEPFEIGVHRALYRVADSNRDSFPIPIERFAGSLDDKDPSIRGYALLIHSVLDAEITSERIRKIADDDCEFSIFNHVTLELDMLKIGEIARQFKQSRS